MSVLTDRDMEFLTRLLGAHTCPIADNRDSQYVQRLYERMADYCERRDIPCEGPMVVSVTEHAHTGHAMLRIHRVWNEGAE